MNFVAGMAPLGPIDREVLLHTLVSGGGAMLLAYAMYVRASGRATPQQVRGLVAAGVGFLASAAASMYLREHATLGPAVSLAGTLVAMYGMLLLVRDRRDRGERQHSRGGRD